jgi:hypothetical protein
VAALTEAEAENKITRKASGGQGQPSGPVTGRVRRRSCQHGIEVIVLLAPFACEPQGERSMVRSAADARLGGDRWEVGEQGVAP